MTSINLGFTFEEKQLIDLLYTFYQNEYQSKTEMQGLFIIGGFVRDRLAGRPIKDLDFLAYGVLFKDLFNFLTKHKQRLGINFRFEIQRMTHENASGKLIFSFKINNLTVDVVQYFGKLKDDLASRDFKCNSLAYDIFSKKLIDYYGGYQDIQQMILQPVESFGRTFIDNYTRFLRMLVLHDKGYAISQQLELETKEYFAKERHFPAGLGWLLELRMAPIFNSKRTSKILRKAFETKIMRSFFNLQSDAHDQVIGSLLIVMVEKIEAIFDMKKFKDLFINCPQIIEKWSEHCCDMKKLAFPFSIFSVTELQNSHNSFEDIKSVVNIKASPLDKSILNELLFIDKNLQPFNKEFFAYMNGVKFMGRCKAFPFIGLFSFFKSLSLQDISNMQWMEPKNFTGILKEFERIEPKPFVQPKVMMKLTPPPKPKSNGVTFLDESEVNDFSSLLKQLSLVKLR